jgi:hypothetical protein
LVLLAFGAWTDVQLGVPLLRGARSTLAWVLGATALGVVYVLSEWSGDRIHSGDSTDHPLWKRLAHLVALLASGAVLFGRDVDHHSDGLVTEHEKSRPTTR